MRGATHIPIEDEGNIDFNPRSPCGERHREQRKKAATILISIHAPHAGSDGLLRQVDFWRSRFQSTLPMRGATKGKHPDKALTYISIHAPHAGSDDLLISSPTDTTISIHAPHAGSDKGAEIAPFGTPDFNPRSPCGERPLFTARDCGARLISIHAPHAGSDLLRGVLQSGNRYFNPRSPCGERPPP